MSDQISIYDYLAKLDMSGVTQEYLHNMSKDTAITNDNVDFWSGVITVARAISESRTFAHGLPIYNSGTVVANEIDDGGNETTFATGSELWLLQNITIPTGCTAWLRDSASGKTSELTTNSLRSGPIYLSANLGLLFINSSGSAATPAFAYYKVSL
jgi:hypothetical protein